MNTDTRTILGAAAVCGLLGVVLYTTIMWERHTPVRTAPSASAVASAVPSATKRVKPEFKLMKQLREGHWGAKDDDGSATVFLVNRLDTLNRQEMWYSKYPWVFWWVHTMGDKTLWFNCGIDATGSEHWRVVHCYEGCKHDWRVAYCTAKEVDSGRLGLVMGPSWYGVAAGAFEGMPFTEQPPAATKLRLYINDKDDLRFQLGDGKGQIGSLVHKKPCGLPPGPPGLLAGDEPNIPLGMEATQPLVMPTDDKETNL